MISRRIGSRACFAVLIAWLCVATTGSVRVTAQDVGTEAQRNAGKTLYLQNCAQCHGEKGDGEGYATPHLLPQPRHVPRLHRPPRQRRVQPAGRRGHDRHAARDGRQQTARTMFDPRRQRDHVGFRQSLRVTCHASQRRAACIERWLGLAGLVAGGPTFIGAMVGYQVTSDALELCFFALAGGAILYVIGEIWAAVRGQGHTELGLYMLGAGFLLGVATDLVVAYGGA